MAVVVAGRLPHRFVRQPGRVTIERAPRLLREIRIDRVGDHDEAPGADPDTDLRRDRFTDIAFDFDQLWRALHLTHTLVNAQCFDAAGRHREMAIAPTHMSDCLPPA